MITGGTGDPQAETKKEKTVYCICISDQDKSTQNSTYFMQ